MTRPSLPLCILFSVFSGFVRVVATMVLAYPDYLEKKRRRQEGDQQEGQQQRSRHRRRCSTRGDIIATDVADITGIDDDSDNLRGDNAEHEEDANETSTSLSASFLSQSPTDHRQHQRWYYLAAHLVLLLAAAVLSVFGTAYGPVSLAVPLTTASTLLWNAAAVGVVLRMRTFDKAQRTGTYVVLFSVLGLVDVGPRIRPRHHDDEDDRTARGGGGGGGERQQPLPLLTVPAVACLIVVTVVLLWTARETWTLWKKNLHSRVSDGVSSSSARDDANRYHRRHHHHHRDDSSSYHRHEDDGGDWKQTAILVAGMTMSNVGMATSGKAFAILHGAAWCAAFSYYVLTATLGVLFSVVSSTLCDQGIFTPLASVALIVVNMVTGMIVWQDHKAVDDTWIAYICCACLMCCGVYLLAEIDLLDRYWHGAVAETVRPTTAAVYRALDTVVATTTHPPPRREKDRSDSEAAYEAWQDILTGSSPAAVWRGELPCV